MLIAKMLVSKIISPLWFLSIMALVLLIWVYQREGWSGLAENFCQDIWLSTKRFAMIVAIFIIITGSINHLSRKNPTVVKDLIAGKYGLVVMNIVAMSLPGPAGAEQLREAWGNGGNRCQVVICLTAMMAMGITMFIFRSKFLGGSLTLVWMGIACTLLIQVWAVCQLKPWTWLK